MIERHGNIFVVRDDLRPGGAKTRFVEHAIAPGARELVYGAPFCGGAPLALAVIGQQLGVAVTIFYAARAELTARQKRVESYGAALQFVSPGYMTVVQARARAYALNVGAQFLPLGIDVPAVEAPFVASLRSEADDAGLDPSEVWCATGSGMLARCLGLAFPSAQIRAVAVGLESRWSNQFFMPSNVEITPAGMPFEKKTKATAPFDSCGHYDRKAWARCVNEAKPGALFFNVLGDE